MSLKYLRRNLIFISNQPEDTTIITTDGERITTQRHLLSAVSPYLAALVSQVDQVDRVAISVPFSRDVVRNVLDNLASEDEDSNEIEDEGFFAAKELGIMFLAQIKEMKYDVKKDSDYDDAISDEELSDIISIDECTDLKGTDSNDELKNKAGNRPKLNKTKKGKKKNCNGDGVSKWESKENKCSTCDLEFKCYSHLSDHNKEVHPGLKSFLCDQCGKRFTTAGNRDTHVKNIHSINELFLCNHCGKGFSTNGSRNMHIDSIHSEGSVLQCPHCTKKFK